MQNRDGVADDFDFASLPSAFAVVRNTVKIQNFCRHSRTAVIRGSGCKGDGYVRGDNGIRHITLDLWRRCILNSEGMFTRSGIATSIDCSPGAIGTPIKFIVNY